MSDEPAKIDINEPVEQGHDAVINRQDGSQVLGTAEEAAQAASAGETNGQYTDVVPAEAQSEPVVAPEAEPEAPADEEPASSDEKSAGKKSSKK